MIDFLNCENTKVRGVGDVPLGSLCFDKNFDERLPISHSLNLHREVAQSQLKPNHSSHPFTSVHALPGAQKE